MFNLTQNQENADQLKVLIKSRIRLLRFYLMQKYAKIYYIYRNLHGNTMLK